MSSPARRATVKRGGPVSAGPEPPAPVPHPGIRCACGHDVFTAVPLRMRLRYGPNGILFEPEAPKFECCSCERVIVIGKDGIETEDMAKSIMEAGHE